MSCPAPFRKVPGFLTLNLQLPVSLLPVLADNRALAEPQTTCRRNQRRDDPVGCLIIVVNKKTLHIPDTPWDWSMCLCVVCLGLVIYAGNIYAVHEVFGYHCYIVVIILIIFHMLTESERPHVSRLVTVRYSTCILLTVFHPNTAYRLA